jgi:hypothetical protein
LSVAKTQAPLEAAFELPRELAHANISAFADALQAKIPELLAPLLKGLEIDTQAFIPWAWQHRQSLNIDTDFPVALRPITRAVWEAFYLFHRSSSLAESLHSWLRPYLQIHRVMPSGCSLYCNSSGTIMLSSGASAQATALWSRQEYKMRPHWPSVGAAFLSWCSYPDSLIFKVRKKCQPISGHN